MIHFGMRSFSGSGRPLFGRWTRLAAPSLFFLLTIYYEELFLKLFCFHAIPLSGAFFTLLFTLPIAFFLGLLCGGVRLSAGRILLPVCTAIISIWVGSQAIYYRMFKTFLTIFSLTKMMMVAQSFGGMTASAIALNWFSIVMLPVVLAILLRNRLLPDHTSTTGRKRRWSAYTVAIQLAALGIILLSGNGALSLRYIYTQAAAPELETQYFGILTQTHLEVRRVLFGIKPDEDTLTSAEDVTPSRSPSWSSSLYHVADIDFDQLMEETEDEKLLSAHTWFSKRTPTKKNEWTGCFAGKNLVWIVAEGFSTLAMDPVRTPTLWNLSHQGFVFRNFYTPLWGVSTSDGEYVTTTSLIPKSGVWSYPLSSDNYMPYGMGNQFRAKGYRTMAFHDYLYDYYDRNLSHPNMGYDYVAMGQGLNPEDLIPPEYLDHDNTFPPSDKMMMDKIVPIFINEEQFMVYCLTVSGHLNYTLEENNMAARHWDEVKDLPYSDPVKCYLACQMELELAVRSLLDQLEAAGKLDDTVIVLSADHYPYGLTDEEYSELLGHTVDPVFEIFKNTLILWNSDMEGPVYVNKYCSSLDVMPTLANLFGLDYDSRLLMGSDILSDAPPLVIFSNYSFLNNQGYYNSVTDKFTPWSGRAPTPIAVRHMIAGVQNRVAYSAAILDEDYYRLVLNGPPLEEKESESFLKNLAPWLNKDRPEHGQKP